MLQMDEIDLRDSTVLVSPREMSDIEKRNKIYKSVHGISCYQAEICRFPLLIADHNIECSLQFATTQSLP